MNISRIVSAALITGVSAVSIAACGGSPSSSAPQVTVSLVPAASQPQSSSAPGIIQTMSSHDADVQACTNLRNAFTTFNADKNQASLNAFEISLSAIPGAAMTPALLTSFQALDGDVQNMATLGSPGPDANADEDAVAAGCAGVGVQMPAGFTS